MLKVFNETARYVDQCFVPDTKVKTNLGYKKISEITVGDMVLNSNGTYNPVSNVKKFEKNERDFITINSSIGENTVTRGHLYLTIKNGKKDENLTYKIQNKLVKAEWVEAENLTTEDILIKMK
jgi:hypothetical protein